MVSAAVRLCLSVAILVGVSYPVDAQGPVRAPAATSDASSPSPEMVLRKLIDVLMEDLRSDKDLARGDPKKMREIFDKKGAVYIDMAGMTEATLGASRWQQLSTASRRELIEQYYQLVIVQYASHLSRIKTAKQVPIRTISATSASAELEANFETMEGAAPVRYRLRTVDGAWKITDIAVLNVWLVPLFRGQFEGALKRGGIDGLIGELAAKNRDRAAAEVLPKPH